MSDPHVAVMMLGIFVLTILLGFPICFTLMGMAVFFGYYAYFDAERHDGTGEVSINSPAGVPVSQVKTVIPVAAGLLFLQGCAQVCRCIVCLKTGEWPAHLEDVEELDIVLTYQHEEEERAEPSDGAAQ